MSTGWETLPTEFPWPPANVQVISPMFVGAMDVRWDNPAILNTGPTTAVTAAGATVTVTGVPQVETPATGLIQVNRAPIPAGTLVVVDEVVLTAIDGARAPGSDEFNGSLLTPAAIAADIHAAVSEGSLAGWAIVTSVLEGAQVYLTAVTYGTVGNEISLATSNESYLSVSGGHLANGLDADTLSVGLVTLTAATERTVGGLDFKVGPTSYDTAESIKDALLDVENRASFITAVANGPVVQITARTPGSDGNSIRLSTSSSELTLSGDSLSGGAGGVSCLGKSNTRWDIVGVNVYRSDNGERGPYIRLNRFPIGSLVYRDMVDNILVEQEVIHWDQWQSRGDAANSRRWTFSTFYKPVVKPNLAPQPTTAASRLQVIHANAPTDVQVQVDGVPVEVDSVFGPLGQVTLVNTPDWDIAREQIVPPGIPTETSTVTVTYYYNRNAFLSGLDRNNQTFYRVTTVALDPSTPSGYIETPLSYSPPVTVAQVETFDYIWREAVRRNLWILEQGGERVKLFKKKVSGIPCPCMVDEMLPELNKQPSNRCLVCYGAGFVGGYDGPIDVILAPDEADRRVSQTPNGRHLEHSYETWLGPSPAVTQRDFVVKQTGERYSIGPVRRPSHRGLPLQQHFTVAYLDEQDIRYQVPVTGIENLLWPETRTTDPNTPCNPAPPHPVGFDYQATPMETNNPEIPAERQIRGRTPVWANITY